MELEFPTQLINRLWPETFDAQDGRVITFAGFLSK